MTAQGLGNAFDWQRILDGPRGRELCLLLASTVENQRYPEGTGPLLQAEFFLGVGDANRSYVMLSPDPLPPRTSDQEFFTSLANADLGDVDADELPDILQQVVMSATYWQPPERRDELLAEPRAIESLRPWAKMLAGHSGAQWWPSAIDRGDQWQVNWPGFDDEADAPTESTLEALARWSRDERESESLAVAEDVPAPRTNCTGRWWSISGIVPATTRRWPDGRIVLEEPVVDNPCEPMPMETWPRHRVVDPLGVTLEEDCSFQTEDASWTRVVVPDDATVLEIDRAETWADLCRRFPLDVSALRRDDWYHTTGRDGAWVIPDWSLVAREVDAVHLGIAQWLELAGRPLSVDEHRSSLIAGWSPDETRWLTGLPTR